MKGLLAQASPPLFLRRAANLSAGRHIGLRVFRCAVRPPHPPFGHLLPAGAKGEPAAAFTTDWTPRWSGTSRPPLLPWGRRCRQADEGAPGAGVAAAVSLPSRQSIGRASSVVLCGPLIRPSGTFSPLGRRGRLPQPLRQTGRLNESRTSRHLPFSPAGDPKDGLRAGTAEGPYPFNHSSHCACRRFLISMLKLLLMSFPLLSGPKYRLVHKRDRTLSS